MNRFHAVAAVQVVLAVTAWLLLRRGRPWPTRIAGLAATAALVPLVVLGLMPSIFTLVLLVALPGILATVATAVWPESLAPVPAAASTDPILPRLAARLHADDVRRQFRRKVLRGWRVGAVLLGLGCMVLVAEDDRRHPCLDIELVIPDGYRGDVVVFGGAATGVTPEAGRLTIRVPVGGVATIRGPVPQCIASKVAREESGAVRPCRLDSWSSSSAGQSVHFRVD